MWKWKIKNRNSKWGIENSFRFVEIENGKWGQKCKKDVKWKKKEVKNGKY